MQRCIGAGRCRPGGPLALARRSGLVSCWRPPVRMTGGREGCSRLGSWRQAGFAEQRASASKQEAGLGASYTVGSAGEARGGHGQLACGSSMSLTWND